MRACLPCVLAVFLGAGWWALACPVSRAEDGVPPAAAAQVSPRLTAPPPPALPGGSRTDKCERCGAG